MAHTSKPAKQQTSLPYQFGTPIEKRKPANMRYNVCQCDKDAKEEEKRNIGTKRKEAIPGMHFVWYSSFFVWRVFFSAVFFLFWHAATIYICEKQLHDHTKTERRTSSSNIECHWYRYAAVAAAAATFSTLPVFYEYIVPLKLIANRENKIRASERGKKIMWKGNPMPKRKKNEKKIYIKHSHTHTQAQAHTS